MAAKASDLKLYRARHTILYAKGHYVWGVMQNDLRKIIKADGGDIEPEFDIYKNTKTTEITMMIRFMVPIVVDVLATSDLYTEMEHHFMYMQQRGAAMIEKKENINDLVLEEMLAIAMGWNMNDVGYTLGDPDPNVLRVNNEKLQMNYYASRDLLKPAGK